MGTKAMFIYVNALWHYVLNGAKNVAEHQPTLALYAN